MSLKRSGKNGKMLIPVLIPQISSAGQGWQLRYCRAEKSFLRVQDFATNLSAEAAGEPPAALDVAAKGIPALVAHVPIL